MTEAPLTRWQQMLSARWTTMSNEYSVGSVLSVLRYPVKSMIGEELTVAHVTGADSLEIVLMH